MVNQLAPDLAQTMAHLEALEADPQARFTFQILPDREDTGVRPAILHGTLADVVDRLAGANNKGAGITVSVNRTDFRGRAAANVVALRALVIDCDQPRGRALALPPSLSIETSSGRGHHYWFLGPGEPLDGFGAAQRQLAAYYGSDVAISDLGRALRLAGFYNMKREPFLVRVVRASPDRRYSIAEVLAAHPRCREARRCRSHPPYAARPCAEAAYRTWSRRAPLTIGSRNRVAFRLALEGFRAKLDPGIVEAEVRGYCESAGIRAEAERVLRSARSTAAVRPR
jgi:hypothetical protein